MDVALRERLPAAAHAAGTDLVIDESFVDLSLDVAEMPPPVAAFDRHFRVLSVGGMSKPFWGGLRIGWIRTSAQLVQRLAAVRVGVDMAGPVLDQLVAARLLEHAALRSSRPAGTGCGPSATRCSARSPSACPSGARRYPPVASRSGPSWTRRSPARWPGRPSTTVSGWRPARASASTARWSASCGCRSRCPRRSWSTRSSASPRPAPTWTARPGATGTPRPWWPRTRRSPGVATILAVVDQDAPDTRPRFIVCGDNSLALRLVDELTVRYAAEVTVILPSGREDLAIGRLAGVTLVESARPTADAYARAGLAHATALALVAQDDAGNIDAALLAQEINPALRIVVRMFNPSLAAGILALLHDGAALSESALAAPSFVAAAMGEGTPTYLSLPGRTLFVARRRDVSDEDVVCGLAVRTAAPIPEVLPADDHLADLVLAGRLESRFAQPAGRGHRRRRHPLRTMSVLVGRRLRLVLAALLAVLAIATWMFQGIHHQGWWQGLYLSVLTTFGAANPDVNASGAEQGLQTVLTVLSIALIPILTAAVVDAAVNARLTLAAVGPIDPMDGHVVVVGLGNVGTRVVTALHEFGVDVVAVDRREQAPGVRVARDLGIPVVIGDATQEGTLRAAWVATCRSLVVLSTDDVSNLETALLGRAIVKDLRVVLRLGDGDFADRVQRAFGLSISGSVSYLAAPVFAAAMMGRAVLDAIQVGRRVLLIAELPVGADSELDGQPVSTLNRPGESRLLAVRTGRGMQALWSPTRAAGWCAPTGSWWWPPGAAWVGCSPAGAGAGVGAPAPGHRAGRPAAGHPPGAPTARRRAATGAPTARRRAATGLTGTVTVPGGRAGTRR